MSGVCLRSDAVFNSKQRYICQKQSCIQNTLEKHSTDADWLPQVSEPFQWSTRKAVRILYGRSMRGDCPALSFVQVSRSLKINNFLLLLQRSSEDVSKPGKLPEPSCPLPDVRSFCIPTWSLLLFQIQPSSQHC